MTRRNQKKKNKNKAKPPQASSAAPPVAPSAPSSEAPRAVSETPPFEMRDIEGKGIEMVAARDLKAGDLVLKESPLFVIEASENPLATLAAIELAYGALSETDCQRFDSLRVATPKKILDRKLAIFESNAFPTDSKPDKEGLFVDGSRFRHSCRPNCSNVWDGEEGAAWMNIAMEDISAGAQLTIGHSTLLAPKARRQATSQEALGFACTCEACALSPEEVVASDFRRVFIQELDEMVTGLQACFIPLKTIGHAKVALGFLEMEGLHLRKAELAWACFDVCSMWGDGRNANLWLDKVLEYERRESGIWSSMYKQVSSLKGNVARQQEWGWLAALRGKKVLEGP